MTSGYIIGLCVGALIALFRGPRLHVGSVVGKTRETLADAKEGLRSQVEAVVPADQVRDSIQEGKKAARRRLDETRLGSGKPE